MELTKFHKRENISENIVYIKYTAIEPSHDQYEDYLKDLYAIYDSQKHFVIIIDSSNCKFLPARLRIRQGVWLKNNEDLVKKQCIAQIFVTPNLTSKMVLEGVFLVQKPVVDYYILENKVKAIQKANELIKNKK